MPSDATPEAKTAKNRERVTGVEPATLCLASTRSGQLSYTCESEVDHTIRP